jgi:hypothetical protein
MYNQQQGTRSFNPMTTWLIKGHEMDDGWNLNLAIKFIIKMFDSTEASDATPLDPGGAVADFFASQGIMGDDQASQRSMSFDITVPLVGDRVACPV